MAGVDKTSGTPPGIPPVIGVIGPNLPAASEVPGNEDKTNVKIGKNKIKFDLRMFITLPSLIPCSVQQYRRLCHMPAYPFHSLTNIPEAQKALPVCHFGFSQLNQMNPTLTIT